MKTCITCMQEKPLHCYAIEKGKHRGSCKDCRREYRKTIAHKINANNREKNRLFPEIAAEYKKKYRSNPENKIKEAEAKKRYRSSPENIARERASNAKWVEANKESIRLKSQEKYFANREEALEVNKAWMARNSEYRKEYTKKYNQENRGRRTALERARQAAKLMATPSWSETKEIEDLYIKSAAIGGMNVDHIVPLKSKLVCGLHVLANLRIIPKDENSTKGNRYWPDMP